jgi:hypothetical protein
MLMVRCFGVQLAASLPLSGVCGAVPYPPFARISTPAFQWIYISQVIRDAAAAAARKPEDNIIFRKIPRMSECEGQLDHDRGYSICVIIWLPLNPTYIQRRKT